MNHDNGPDAQPSQRRFSRLRRWLAGVLDISRPDPNGSATVFLDEGPTYLEESVAYSAFLAGSTANIEAISFREFIRRRRLVRAPGTRRHR